MDCRKALWSAGALAFGLTGCLKSHTGGLVAAKDLPKPPEQPIVQADEKSAKPGKLKVTTLVAMANLRLQMAQDPKNDDQRPQLVREAADSYQKALKEDGKYLPAFVGLARCQELMGNYDQAMVLFQRARETAPKEPGLWYEQGMCQARAKDFDGALVALGNAVRLAPDHPVYAKVYGFTLARAGRYDEGLNWLMKGMNEADAHLNLAKMLAHLDQMELSQRHVQVALQLNPANEDAQQFYAELRGAVPSGGVTPVKYEEATGTPELQVGFEPGGK